MSPAATADVQAQVTQRGGRAPRRPRPQPADLEGQHHDVHANCRMMQQMQLRSFVGPDYADAGSAGLGDGGGRGEILGIIRELSGQLLEECEQAVGRAVAPGADARGGGPVQGALFECLVGMDVDLGSFGVLVPEPERDHGDVVPGKQ